jgi:transposase
MIEQDKRKAIYLLHTEGMKIRDISRQLRVNRNTVRAIIKQAGVMPDEKRADKIEIDRELLSRLYDECCGRIQRIHEKLTEEEKIEIGYSTLSRMIREFGFGQDKSARCDRVPDKPGVEMQHDTSDYTLLIGGKKVHVIGSIIYFRYSKMRYLKFYRSFNRFSMKCFFHEALTFFGYSASTCIIDNTNLARLRGAGSNAIICPEMEKFARQYGFSFVCHEIGHSNRKAGNERSFYTVETNFFPGRSFADFEDLNEQAFQWATVRMPNRPVSKTMLIPAKAFEYEKPLLVKVPPYVSPPYLIHKRDIDQYGYLSFDGNYYWVPGTSRGEVILLQYSKKIEIYQSRQLLITYFLPKEGVKNKSFTPDGLPRPEHKPKNRHCPTLEEEKKLRATDKRVDEYLDFALKEKGRERHKIIRSLFGLYKKITPSLFIKTIERAMKYRITNMSCIERIAVLQMADGDIQIPSVDIDEQFQSRDAYREGQKSDEVDLNEYEKLMEDDDTDG